MPKVEINLDTRAGRMLAGMVEHGNRNAKMVVTVSLFNGDETRLHQALRLRTWEGRDGERMLTADLMDGDWEQGVHATKVAHLNLTRGTQSPARDLAGRPNAELLRYAAKAAFHYCTDGKTLTPPNGRVVVQEEAFCGCCGRELTHPDSIEIGIGPECAKRLGADAERYGMTIASRKRKPKETVALVPAEPGPVGFLIFQGGLKVAWCPDAGLAVSKAKKWYDATGSQTRVVNESDGELVVEYDR